MYYIKTSPHVKKKRNNNAFYDRIGQTKGSYLKIKFPFPPIKKKRKALRLIHFILFHSEMLKFPAFVFATRNTQ